MQLPSHKHLATIAEYLRYENAATNKHEYRDGEVLAMAGNSVEHSRIFMNFGRELGNALKGKPCAVFDYNLRIGIPRSARYTYPDASVICGKVELDPNDTAGQTATNPRVLVEILSPSTELYDRGEKFRRYRMIDTLQEYILISQDTARIEVYNRQPNDAWIFTAIAGLDARLHLASLQVEIALAEIYAGVEFPPATESEDNAGDRGI